MNDDLDDYDDNEYCDDYDGDYEPSTSGGGGGRFQELQRIKDEPNQDRKRELLRWYAGIYGEPDDLTKRWVGLRGY